MNIRAWGSATKETFTRFLAADPFTLAAALSYYTLLSLAPILLVILAVAGFIWGEQAVRGELVGQIESVVGQQGAQAVQTVIASAGEPGHGAVAMTIGIVTLLLGATTVFAQLQASLNRIWNVQARPNRSAVLGFLQTRLLSLAVVIGIGLLLLGSLALNAIISGARDYLDQWIPGLGWVWQAMHLVLSLAIVTLLIALLFKYLPDVLIRWRDVWVGAVITAALFVVGQFAISFYLGQASVGSPYGAAGSLIVLVVWVYYSALILLLGAQITQVYARRMGPGIEPASYAMPYNKAA